jgi:hypothetical protein
MVREAADSRRSARFAGDESAAFLWIIGKTSASLRLRVNPFFFSA